MVKKQLSLLDRLFKLPDPDKNPDKYKAPVDMIPDGMENVIGRKLWNNRIYLISSKA
ncbi:hypothetical protein [Natranaerobius trueperi]|uniref:hypothetical protein n=1 Tax=Natranaerobius trueperi TaxID=759412 RepID=UPI00197BC712|nr:hypothetical protein [Natranaerobius trueperi]